MNKELKVGNKIFGIESDIEGKILSEIHITNKNLNLWHRRKYGINLTKNWDKDFLKSQKIYLVLIEKDNKLNKPNIKNEGVLEIFYECEISK